MVVAFLDLLLPATSVTTFPSCCEPATSLYHCRRPPPQPTAASKGFRGLLHHLSNEFRCNGCGKLAGGAGEDAAVVAASARRPAAQLW